MWMLDVGEDKKWRIDKMPSVPSLLRLCMLTYAYLHNILVFEYLMLEHSMLSFYLYNMLCYA